MSTPKDGGPAFPSAAIPSATDYRNEARDGMTLRDYFAAAALPIAWGDLARTEDSGTGTSLPSKIILKPGEDVYTASEYVAELAYAFADAMLAERAKGSP